MRARFVLCTSLCGFYQAVLWLWRLRRDAGAVFLPNGGIVSTGN